MSTPDRRPSRSCDSVLWAGSRCSFSCAWNDRHEQPHACGAVEWDDLDAYHSDLLWGPLSADRASSGTPTEGGA